MDAPRTLAPSGISAGQRRGRLCELVGRDEDVRAVPVPDIGLLNRRQPLDRAAVDGRH